MIGGARGETNKMDDISLMRRNEWYSTSAVKFQLIKSTFRREVAFLVPSFSSSQFKNTRMLKVHSVQHWDIVRKGLKFNEKPYNVYSTLAKYEDGIPNQTLNLAKRDNDEWKQNHYNHMIGYDFLLDIDAPSHEYIDLAHESAIQIKRILDYHGIPHIIRFSGCGFHFIIPYLYFNIFEFDPWKEGNIYLFYRKIAGIFHDQVSEFVDMNIYDARRLCKLPYSAAIYQKNIYICLPFHSEEQFKSFKLEDYNILNLTQNYQDAVRNHKQKLFNEGGTVGKMFEWVKHGKKKIYASR